MARKPKARKFRFTRKRVALMGAVAELRAALLEAILACEAYTEETGIELVRVDDRPKWAKEKKP